MGPIHCVTKEEAGAYHDEFEKQMLTVADAVCIDCEAPYLAWVGDMRHEIVQLEHGCFSTPFFDLSHRNSFNDEPGKGDYPKWTVERVVRRVPWDGTVHGYRIDPERVG